VTLTLTFWPQILCPGCSCQTLYFH